MNIPFFEILVLLFVLWPLIQRFLDKNKPKSAESGDTRYTEYDDPFESGPRSPDRKEEPDWNEAMRELEIIFTGEPPSRPTPEELQAPTARRQNLDRKRDVESTRYNNRLDKDMVNTRRRSLESMQSRPLKQSSAKAMEAQSADEMVEELMESENPIYTSLNVAPQIKEDSDSRNYSVFEDVRNPQSLREFYVMKEILDKPVSKRRLRNFV